MTTVLPGSSCSLCVGANACETYSCNAGACTTAFNSYSRACYTGPGGTEGFGTCVGGTETCSSGSFGPCDMEVTPVAEVCDGMDTNCDNVGDGSCGCIMPSDQSCWPGAPINQGKGECSDGIQDCQSDGTWGTCGGASLQLPEPEICDGLDNDCDNVIDMLTQDCYTGPGGTENIGACRGGTDTCVSTTWGGCVGEITPTGEVCDGLVDDNCDGSVDEGCACSTGDLKSCYGGLPATRNVGRCSDGYQECVDGAWSGCQGATEPSAEICANSADDNCDGTIDEFCACTPPLTQACYAGPDGTAGVGECANGGQTCVTGPNSWGMCLGSVTPQLEVDDFKDNDCDGSVDEGIATSCVTGDVMNCYTAPTGSGVGVCQAGYQLCDSGVWGECQSEIVPSEDICDGLDNDCDGVPDDSCLTCSNGVTQGCYSGPSDTRDVGLCGSGAYLCLGGTFGSCVGDVIPDTELCDGLDNNCNGIIDDGCLCTDNNTAPCYTGPKQTQDVGMCADGITTCSSTNWGFCVGEITPSLEVCDGVDNDCDGSIDEGITCPCIEGDTKSCYEGPNGTRSVGICTDGVQVCELGGWTPCWGDITPQPEIQDTLDNDCDGTPDDGVVGCSPITSTQACFTGSPDFLNVGACMAGTQECKPGGFWDACTDVLPTAEEPFGLDGVDNNCDGTVDEGLNNACVNGSRRGCYGALITTKGTGVCHSGQQWCENGQWGACVGQNLPTIETCDGLDNDCDTEIDEDCTSCTDGDHRTCYSGPAGSEDAGTCSPGLSTCTNGVWGSCAGEVTPSGESCDGLDNNCNGVADEGPGGCCIVPRNCYTGPPTTAGVGICAPGEQQCIATAYTACFGETVPQTELCGDGLDNDCDGTTDEVECLACTGGPHDCYNGPPSTAGIGACTVGVQTCSGTSWGTCAGEVGPALEICDYIDNDCDGVVDNGCPVCNTDAACAATDYCVAGFCEPRVGPRETEDVPIDAGNVQGIQFADFNGDGWMDFVIGYGPSGTASSMEVFMNGGPLASPRFTPVANDPGMGFVRSVAVGDCEGDGDIDILFYGDDSAANDKLFVFVNDGSAGFTKTLVDRGGDAANAAGWADFDNDGDLDIAANVNDGGDDKFFFYENDGACSHSYRGSATSIVPAMDIEFGDLNRDGTTDLVAIMGNRLEIWGAFNAGGFRYSKSRGESTVGTATKIAIGDFTGDGMLDVGVAHSDALNRIYSYDNVLNLTGSIAFGNVNAETHELAFGDFTGDGLVDVVECNNHPLYPDRMLTYNFGTSQAEEQWVNDLTPPAASCALADIDNDGDLDLMFGKGNTSADLDLYLNHAPSFPGTSDGAVGVAATSPGEIHLLDLKQDGWLDMVQVESSTSTIRMLEGNPAYTFSTRAVATFAGTERLVSLDIGDWDGDSDLDFISLVKNATDSNVYVSLYDDAADAFTTTVLATVPSTVERVFMGDADNDGDLDLFLVGSVLRYYQQDDAATITQVGAVGAGRVWRDAVVANVLEGTDGPELITVDTTNAEVHVYTYDQLTAPIFVKSLASAPTSVASDDFDGDGHVDLVIGFLGAPPLVIFGDGAGNFPNEWRSRVDVSATRITTGDINLDGNPDFAVATAAGESLTYFLSTGQQFFRRAWAGNGSGVAANRAVALGDMDADGDLDIFSVNTSGGVRYAVNRVQDITRESGGTTHFPNPYGMPNDLPDVLIQRVGATPYADGYSVSRKLNGPLVPITFKLEDHEGDPLAMLEVEFWKEGSGWEPATLDSARFVSNINQTLQPFPGLVGNKLPGAFTSHNKINAVKYHVEWDAAADAGYGQQVKIRLVAYPAGQRTSPIQYAKTVATTPIFRVEDPCAQTPPCLGGQQCFFGTCYDTCVNTAACMDATLDTCYLDTDGTDGFCNTDGTGDPAVDACTGITCPLGQMCYSGTCYEACMDDGDCSPPFYCNGTRCLPNQTPPADPDAACVEVNCPGGTACYGGTCYLECTSSMMCSGECFGDGTGICDTDSDQCNNITCPSSDVCYQGTCFPSCVDSDDCSPPTECLDGLFCGDPDDTCAGVTCPVEQSCYGGTCFDICGTTADCDNPDDVCFDSVCRDPDNLCDGVICPVDQTCHMGFCFDTCASDGDCENGDECYAETTDCTTPAGFDVRWIGALDSDWDEPQNWVPTSVPSGTENAYVCAGVTQPQLRSNSVVNNLLFAEGAGIDYNGYALTVNGAKTYTQWCQDDSDVCDGISCPTNFSCWGGTCYQDCASTGECSPPYVCFDGIGCIDDPCQGVSCPLGQACYQGGCYDSCGSDVDCSDPAYAECFGGRCSDTACTDVSCEVGEHCEGGTCYVTCALNTDCPNYTGSSLAFIDVASSTNILVTAPKGGSTAGDLNGDGWLDISVSTRDSGLDTIFFRNDANAPDPKFLQFARCDQAGAENYEMDRSQLIADFNNDGWNDYMHNSGLAANIYLNVGGVFPWTKRTNVCAYNDTDGAELIGSNMEGIVAIDYDGDKDIDLIAEDGNAGFYVFRNDTCVGAVCGNPWSMTRIAGTTIGLSGTANNGDFCAAADFDVDGDVDFICRKSGLTPPDLYVNNGLGTFTASATFNQPASNGNKGGAAFCDFDNDGDFDIFWGEAGSNQFWEQTAPNTWVATGEPLASTGVALSAIDGVACGDVDNDGDVDLFLSGSGDDFLFLNKLGSWEHRNIGITGDQDGESVLMLDYDRSGSLDIFINQDNLTQLWRNPRSDDRYLIIRALVDFGLGVTRDAIGATITIKDADGVIIGTREVNGGKGHGSQDPAYVHYGLPYGADVPYMLEVKFPHGGTVQRCVVPSAFVGYQLAEIHDTDTDDLTACTPGWAALIELPSADPTASEYCYDDYCAYGACDRIQCSSGYSCYGGNCKTVCTDSTMCPAGEICDGGKCVDNTDPLCDGGDFICPATWDCIDGDCFPLCQSDSDCDIGSFCYDGICKVDDCSFVSCDSTETCVHGICFEDCMNDSDCAADEGCYEGRCADDGCLALTDTFEANYLYESLGRGIHATQFSKPWFWPRAGESAGDSMSDWVTGPGYGQVPQASKARVSLFYQDSSSRFYLWFQQGATAGQAAAQANYRIRMEKVTSSDPTVTLIDGSVGWDIRKEKSTGDEFVIHAQVTTGANETGGFVVGPIDAGRDWNIQVAGTFAGDIAEWEFWDAHGIHTPLDTREELRIQSVDWTRGTDEIILGPDSRMPCLDPNQLGICQGGFGMCNQKRQLECTPTVLQWDFEVCDGLDNDCDGAVDEDVFVAQAEFRQRSDQEWTTWPTIDVNDGVQTTMNFQKLGASELIGSPDPQRVDGSGSMLDEDYTTLFSHRDTRDGSISMALVHGKRNINTNDSSYDAKMRIQHKNAGDSDDEIAMAWFDDRDPNNDSTGDKLPHEVDWSDDFEYKYEWRLKENSKDKEADGGAWRSLASGISGYAEMEAKLEWTKDDDKTDKEKLDWQVYVPRVGFIDLEKKSNKDLYWRVKNVPLGDSVCATANGDPFAPLCHLNRYTCNPVSKQIECPANGDNNVCYLCGDADGDGFDAYDPVVCTSGRDCNDNPSDPQAKFTNPLAAERCDGLDNDCDGVADVKDDVEYAAKWGEPRPLAAEDCPAGTKCGPEECSFNLTCVCPEGPEEFGNMPSTLCRCGEGLEEAPQASMMPDEPSPAPKDDGFDEPDSACSATSVTGSAAPYTLLVLLGFFYRRRRQR